MLCQSSLSGTVKYCNKYCIQRQMVVTHIQVSYATWRCPGILFCPGKILEFFKTKDLSWKSPEKINSPLYVSSFMMGDSMMRQQDFLAY